MIWCCGEALIDMIPTRLLDGHDALVPTVGGSVFNTAIALGRLGAPVSFVSGLSTDLFGAELTQALQQSYVDISTAMISDRPTTLAFVKLIDGNATYTFYDENTAGREVTTHDLPLLADPVKAVFIGGISLVVDPCGESYSALAGAAADSGRVIYLDPNIRPGFIQDEAAYRKRLDYLISIADIVKVSTEDLAWLVPEAPGVQARAQRLQLKGAGMVLVTLGGDGAMALTWEGVVSVPGQNVPVVDTVGAGDSFNAGVLESLYQSGKLSKDSLSDLTDQDVIKALERGVKVASVVVSRAGANAPWSEELVD